MSSYKFGAGVFVLIAQGAFLCFKDAVAAVLAYSKSMRFLWGCKGLTSWPYRVK